MCELPFKENIWANIRKIFPENLYLMAVFMALESMILDWIELLLRKIFESIFFRKEILQLWECKNY